jgi:protein-disulfide isomerase
MPAPHLLFFNFLVMLIFKQKIMNNLIPKIFFGLSIVALAVVVFVVVKSSKDTSVKEEILSPIKKGEKVVIDEYSDFQCPACKTPYPVLKELKEKYPDKIEFNYYHFPLSYHKNAELAAKAAESARAQKKFWEYHNLLFEKQKEWENLDSAGDLFKKYARDLKLDTAKFERDLNSKETAARVRADYEKGVQKKVDATPTIFVNGQRVEGFKSWEEFGAAVEEKIK